MQFQFGTPPIIIMSKHPEQPWTKDEIEGLKGQKLDMRGAYSEPYSCEKWE